MNESTTTPESCASSTEHCADEVIDDPEVPKEFADLENEDDRADLAEALQGLKEIEEQGTILWDDIKGEMGL
jgi:hypothetical protein